MSSFYNERNIKATRKVHACNGCATAIPAGSPAYYFAMRGDEFWSGHYHPDCRKAEVALNDARGWRYGDDWMLLMDAESDDRPMLREEFPAVAERLFGPAPDQEGAE